MLASVYDMEQTICSFEGVETFDALTIGPITEHPLVREVFKLPQDQQEVLQVFLPYFLLHPQADLHLQQAVCWTFAMMSAAEAADFQR